jgi:5-methylcytosine-specific restriction endonuclease McrA
MTAEDASVDHIIPQAHGGPSAIGNLRLAHSRCNTERADECPGCPVCAAPAA